MSQEQTIHNSKQPTHSLPIISTPQPLLPIVSKHIYINPQDQLEIYKREYHRLVKENNFLLAHLAKVTEEKEFLQSKYNTIQVHQQINDEKKKRVRRTANQITRQFNCPSQKCGKSYGTEASLTQHIKLKHKQYFESKEYQQLISNLRKKIKETGNCSDQGQSNPSNQAQKQVNAGI